MRSRAKKNLEARRSHVYIIHPLQAPGERDRGENPKPPDHTTIDEEGLFHEIRCVNHCIAVQGKVGETPIFQGDCANTHPFPGDIPPVGRDKYAPGKSSGNTLSQVILTRRELNQGYGGSSFLAGRSYASRVIESVGLRDARMKPLSGGGTKKSLDRPEPPPDTLKYRKPYVLFERGGCVLFCPLPDLNMLPPG
jgi:hypothetical protein